MHWKLLVALSLSVSLLSLGQFAVTAQNDGASASVPMFRGNPARTGEMPGPGPDPAAPVEALWRFDSNGSIFSFGDPAVADGVVYVGSSDNSLYAIDAASGEHRWAFTAGSDINSSPAVVDGVVFVGSYDGSLYALDAASGQPRWSFATGDSIYSSPAVVDGVVYVGSRDGSLYAIDAASGQQRWSFATGDAIQSSPAVVDEVVYVGSEDGSLFAIDARSGEQRWAFTAGGGIDSSPAVVDGIVYVGSWDGRLYAIDASSGEQRWTFATSGGSIDSSPAVVDGMVYVGSWDGRLFAIDVRSGEQRWGFVTGGNIASSAAVADSVVYVGSSDGSLYAIDARSGEQRWAFATGGSIDSSPAVIDGAVYVASEDGSLYAIGNPSPEMLLTATAESNETATAEAAITATADAQAALAATAEAIEQSWQTYFWTDLQGALTAEINALPGLSLASGGDGFYSPNIPPGAARMAIYPVGIAGGTAGGWVVLQVFPTADEANGAMSNMSGGLARSGWQKQDVDGLSHDHACLTLQHADSSEAVCYMTRDNSLIISSSNVAVPTPDAALQNAVDLANAMSNAFDQVDQPDELGSPFGDSQ